MQKTWSILLGLLFLAGGLFLYLALIGSPPAVGMGDLVRAMYFHVTSAWVAMTAFCASAASSAWYLISRKPIADAIASSATEVGLVFGTLTLVTGSLWARPIWNTWWTWDPRLTTTLILWFLYLGYVILRKTMDASIARARVSAIYSLVACIDIPIVHLSVTWWRSIHPTVVDNTGFHMAPLMTVTLLFGLCVGLFIFLLLVAVRTRLFLTEQRAERVLGSLMGSPWIHEPSQKGGL